LEPNTTGPDETVTGNTNSENPSSKNGNRLLFLICPSSRFQDIFRTSQSRSSENPPRDIHHKQQLDRSFLASPPFSDLPRCGSLRELSDKLTCIFTVNSESGYLTPRLTSWVILHGIFTNDKRLRFSVSSISHI